MTGTFISTQDQVFAEVFSSDPSFCVLKDLFTVGLVSPATPFVLPFNNQWPRSNIIVIVSYVDGMVDGVEVPVPDPVPSPNEF